MNANRRKSHGILIVDDQPIMRRGLKDHLSKISGVRVEAECKDREKVLETMAHHSIDLVLLEVSLPNDGLLVLEEIKHHHPNVPVLVYSAHPECEYGLRAQKAGAAGYVCKSSPAEELSEAVRTILRGKKYVSSTTAINAVDGTTSAVYEFDPFGQTIRLTGNVTGENPYRFSTTRTDSASDLVHYEYRTLGTGLGRWLSRDRIGEMGGEKSLRIRFERRVDVDRSPWTRASPSTGLVGPEPAI